MRRESEKPTMVDLKFLAKIFATVEIFIFVSVLLLNVALLLLGIPTNPDSTWSTVWLMPLITSVLVGIVVGCFLLSFWFLDRIDRRR
jgi:hypothetical protein